MIKSLKGSIKSTGLELVAVFAFLVSMISAFDGVFYWLGPILCSLSVVLIFRLNFNQAIYWNLRDPEVWFVVVLWFFMVINIIGFFINGNELYWPIHALADSLKSSIIILVFSKRLFYVINALGLILFNNVVLLVIYLLYFWGFQEHGLQWDLTQDGSGISKNALAELCYILIGVNSYVVINKKISTRRYVVLCSLYLIITFVVGSSKIMFFAAIVFVLSLILSRQWLFAIAGVIVGRLAFFHFEENDYGLVFAGIAKIGVLLGLSNSLKTDWIEVGEHHVGERSHLIESSYNIFLENPVLGIGLENTRNVLETYSHNNLIEILVGVGVPGAIAFYCLISYTIFGGFSRHEKMSSKVFAAVIFVSIFVITWFTNMYRSTPILFLVFNVNRFPALIKKTN